MWTFKDASWILVLPVNMYSSRAPVAESGWRLLYERTYL